MKSYSNILCPYQQSIRLCVSDTWRLNKNMMVQMPTGLGKLHSLASVIHEHLQERQRQSVWIATHRRELVEQIEDTVVRYGIRKEEGLVCSSQWLSHHWEDVENDRSDLIVIDEAHRALAETYKELWAHYPDAKN